MRNLKKVFKYSPVPSLTKLFFVIIDDIWVTQVKMLRIFADDDGVRHLSKSRLVECHLANMKVTLVGQNCQNKQY
jgi:hypothetical protein